MTAIAPGLRPGHALVAGYTAVAVAYVVSRLSLLGRFPPHTDEATFAKWALDGYEKPGPALFEALASGQQPLLPWLGAASMTFGVEPLTAVRLVSFAAGALTLAVVATFATRLFGQWTGLLAGALYALAPFTLLYGVLGLYDPLATFFIATAMVLQYEHARRPRLDLALLLGLTLAGAVLTKLTAYSALYLVPLSALVFDWSRSGLPRRLFAWVGGLAIAFLLAFVATRVLLLSELADDLETARQLLAQHSVGEALADPERWIRQNWPVYRNVIHVYLTLPLVVAAAVGLGLLLRRDRRVGAFIGLWIAIPLGGLVLLSSTPYGRWVLIVAPQLILLAAHGLLETVRRVAGAELRRPVRRAAVAGLACAALLPAVWFDLRLLADPTGPRLPRVDDVAYITGYASGTPWENVAARLRARTRRAQGPVVVAAGGFCCSVLPLELRRDAHLAIASAETDDRADALFGIENGVPLPARADGLTWRRLATVERPRGDAPVHLYESGIVVELEFASTPTELRRLVGGADADFDDFVAARPAVGAWLAAWYRAFEPA